MHAALDAPGKEGARAEAAFRPDVRGAEESAGVELGGEPRAGHAIVKVDHPCRLTPYDGIEITEN
eukprot:2699760-Pyramimonas_sp.AAC.1